MVTGKGPTKKSTSEEKPITKSSHGEYCTYFKQSGHTKDTCYKRYGKEKVLEQRKFLNEWNIQAFSKEKMDRLRALLNSTSKPLGSCGLTMNELTTGRTIGVAKEQSGLYYLQHTKI
ncbi:hypothetical protein CR513_03123, partial [Mucuna pruriens]